VIVEEKVQRWTDVQLTNYILIIKRDPGTGQVIWDDDHPDNQAAHDALMSKLIDHFAKKGTTLTVHVKPVGGGIEHSEFDTWKEVWYYARKAYFGKGSPEEVQITLQLAARFGLLGRGTLQDYCDKYLGLDCNGFAGNYLVHGFRGGDWQLAEPMGADYLANKTVGVMMRAVGKPVNRMEDLVPANTYLLGLAGSRGNIIEQFEGGSIAHIVVIQSGIQYMSAYPEGKTTRDVLTMLAVESTGHVGLTQARCQFVSVTPDGVFSVKRFSHPEEGAVQFRIYRIT
jgi:hypothetical protein